jgi:hypothetical protein
MSSIEECSDEFPICPLCKYETTFWVGEKNGLAIAYFNTMAYLQQDDSQEFPRVHNGAGGWSTYKELMAIDKIWCDHCKLNYHKDDPGFADIINVAINLIAEHGE